MSIELNAELIVTLADEILKFAKLSTSSDFQKTRSETLLVTPVVDKALHKINAKQLAARSDQIFKIRRARDAAFKCNGLFADPAWDLLLDLFSAHLKGVNISVSNACLAASVPPTTALRWIDTLIEAGLAERVSDPIDMRRKFIRLTPDAIAKLTVVLAD